MSITGNTLAGLSRITQRLAAAESKLASAQERHRRMMLRLAPDCADDRGEALFFAIGMLENAQTMNREQIVKVTEKLKTAAKAAGWNA